MKFKKLVSVVCTVAMLMSAAIPGAALSNDYQIEDSSAKSVSAESGAPDYVEVSTEGDLYGKLISPGDVNIKLTGNIGVTFTDDRVIRYPVGKGKKVLDLNGYSFSVDAQYYYTADGYVGAESQYLFGLASGSELVVNDSSVTLPSGSSLIQSGGIYFTNSAVYASDCFSQRNIFLVMGGSLTINSGNFTAGNVKKVGKGGYHLMANGMVVGMSAGSFTLNGGTLTGYGGSGTDYDDSHKTGHVIWTRNAVVSVGTGCVDTCTVNINDGVINGYGCSDAFNIGTAPDTTIQGEQDLVDTDRFCVRACKINLDYYKDVVVELGGYTPFAGTTKDMYWVLHPGNGRVGLNVKFPADTECYIGNDNVTDQPTPFYSTSSMVIRPKTDIGDVSVSYVDGNLWDLLSPCRFNVTFPKNYFPSVTSDDVIRYQASYLDFELVDESGNSIAQFTQNVTDSTGQPVIIDLGSRLNESQKDQLIRGNFYYLKAKKIENRGSASAYYEIKSIDKVNEKGTVILISEPKKIEEVNAVITAPKVGATISSEIKQEGSEDICTAQFYGWYVDNVSLVNGSVFEYDKTYEARVKLTPKDGHKFSDTAKFTINGKDASVVQKTIDGAIIVSTNYIINRDVISYVNCTVSRPATGQNPPTAAVPEDEEYTVESVQVYESEPPHKVLSSTGVCKASTKYVVSIRVKAKEGMRFSNDTTFCINHYTARLATLVGGSGSAVIEKEYTTGNLYLDTASVTMENSIIKEGDKAYIPEFVSDEPSDYEVTFRNWFDYTAFETNGDFIYLSENDPFETGNTYNLNVTLKPKSDKYTIDTQTKLNINGVEAKFSHYSSSKQEYYYTLPMVCRKVISSAYCTVTEPTAGGSPVFTAVSSDPTMYSVGYVDYSYVSNGTESHLGTGSVFQEGRQYRVYVEFEPTDQYVFADDAEFYINDVIAKKYYSKRFRIFYVGDHAHELTHWTGYDATCTKEGMIEHWSCSLCQRNFEDEAGTKEITGSVKIPKTAHTPGAPVKEHETWFTYDSVIYCTVCGEELSREWVATSGPGHEHTAGEEHKENEVAATCTKEGSYDLVIRCTECDDIMAITHVETAKLPHTPGEVKKENDTGDTWDDVTYCTICNTELTRYHQTKNHQHKPGTAVKENENETGYDEVIYCTECGAELNRNHVDKTSAGVPLGILGDMDNDGSITSADALSILRGSVGLYIIDDKKKPIADIDSDSTVTSADALAVLRYSVGIKDKEGKINTPVYA
ncbi:MAG: dockerin type I repeat-containing protein [Clostridia bacterium]|nr:dockerin type I repeat-containing protein [Clostridia bacterium]